MAKAETAVEAAAENEKRLKRAKLAEELSEGGHIVAAKSWTDMVEGVNAMATAAAVANLGRVAARAGAKDVLEGRQVLAASQDLAAQSLAMKALSAEDLELGLAVAGIAGQLGAVTGVVDRLGPSVLIDFLQTRSEQLQQLAETVILRAGDTGTLAKRLAETSWSVAELGEAEVAEGEAEYATSVQEAAEGEELAGEGLELMMMGIAEAVAAGDLQEEADKIAEEGGSASAEAAKPAG